MQTDEKQIESQDSVAAASPVKADENLDKVISRINDADSILVTLSKDPSVDEMTAALGLTLMLDKMGKHATAIYSGKTPNALKFLKPDETFETDTNSLQDFIIALNKEKADHLRYKIEGDFVKVYITPYKTTISEKDLEFSRGEVNVDLVIALDVIETEDLDGALASHGRIMHNASLVNISNTAPGRLGGVEWSNPLASSVSEMIVTLFEEMKQEISKEVATALLTGIVSATERFSNERTTPETMTLASKLMQLGADQQLIVAQMMSAKEDSEEESGQKEDSGKVEDVLETNMPEPGEKSEEQAETKEPGLIQLKHDEEKADDTMSPEQQLEQMIAGASTKTESVPIMEELARQVPEVPAPEVSTPEVQVPEVSAPEVTVPEAQIPETQAPEAPAPDFSLLGMQTSETQAPTIQVPKGDEGLVAAVPTSKVPVADVYGTNEDRVSMQDGQIAPLENEEKPKDYGAMMEEALAEPANSPVMGTAMSNPAMMAAPVVPTSPEVQPAEQQDINTMVNQMINAAQQPVPQSMTQPAPQPMAQPVLQPMTQPAPQPMANGVELPPPPSPEVSGMMPPAEPSLPPVVMPQDESMAQGIPTAPEGAPAPVEPVNPVVVQPVQDPTSVPPVQDPGAFKIPGM